MPKDRDNLIMPDFSHGTTAQGRLVKTGGSYKRDRDTPDEWVLFTLKCELKTSEGQVMGDIVLPACFDNTKDRGRFQAGLSQGSTAEVKETPRKEGTLTIQRMAGDEADEGWTFGAQLTEQVLVCGDAGKAKCVYRWEFLCQCEDVGNLARVLGREVLVTFSPSQPDLLAPKRAQSLTGET